MRSYTKPGRQAAHVQFGPALVCLAATCSFITVSRAAPADETREIENVIVQGVPLTPFESDAGLAPLAETNTALLLRRVAGANVNFNGSLAGIAQYRGLFGPRVNIAVDGMEIGNACSNHMDAPLHYLPRTFVDRFELPRGIAPVSSGLETLGGTVVASGPEHEFGESAAFAIDGRLSSGFQSVDLERFCLFMI